ncbi:hypothetical protein ASD58_21605 [Duganella sp. Root1480D1]|nr:hypothetical protein ASD58_21605 [Duganella sp. Root1480D1]
MLICNVEMANHVYSVVYGKGETIGHYAQCQNCHSELPARLNKFKTLADGIAPLVTLVRTTNPRVYETEKGRLDIERMIKEGTPPLPRDVRFELMLEKFHAVEPEIRNRLDTSRVDRSFIVALAAYVVAALFILPLLIRDSMRLGQVQAYMLLGTFLLLGYLMLTAHARFLRGSIYPKLSAALRPLKPGPKELDLILRMLKQRRLVAGTALKARKLTGWLARTR